MSGAGTRAGPDGEGSACSPACAVGSVLSPSDRLAAMSNSWRRQTAYQRSVGALQHSVTGGAWIHPGIDSGSAGSLLATPARLAQRSSNQRP